MRRLWGPLALGPSGLAAGLAEQVGAIFKRGKLDDAPELTPQELLSAIARYGAWGDPIWGSTLVPRPQPYNQFVKKYGNVVWVYLAVSINARNLAAVPLKLYRKTVDKDGNPELDEVHDHPLQDLLSKVNPLMTRYELWETTSANLDLVGNSYWLLFPDAKGTPVEMWPLRPDRISMIPDPTEGIWGYRYELFGHRFEFARKWVIHIRQYNPWHDFYGQGALSAAWTEAETFESATRYRRAFYANSGRPDGMLSTDQNLTEPQMVAMREMWQAMHQGPDRAHRIAVMHSGLKYQLIAASPKDADVVRDMENARQNILSAFGVPLAAAGIETGDVGRRDEQIRHYRDSTIKPRCLRIEESINEFLVTPFFGDGLEAHFDFTEFIREDEERRTRIDAQEIEAGIRTINEVRVDRGLDPVAWGDTWWVPLSKVTVDQQMEIGPLSRGEERADVVAEGPEQPGRPAPGGGGKPPKTESDTATGGSSADEVGRPGDGETPPAESKALVRTVRQAVLDAITKYSSDQPRDEQGRWSADGGASGEGEGGRGGDRTAPPKRPFEAPPAPRGRAGGRAGGYSATGRTNTEIGDLGEAVTGQLQLVNMHPGQRRGPLDRQYDHTDYAFEVKTLTTQAAEYKVKMKAHEVKEKEAYAREHNLKPGTMMVVVDVKGKQAWAYWREGIGNYRLNEDWNFLGKVRVKGKQADDPETKDAPQGSSTAEHRVWAPAVAGSTPAPATKFDPDQPRDEQGRWSADGGGGRAGDGGDSSGGADSHAQTRLAGQKIASSQPLSGGKGSKGAQVVTFKDGSKAVFKPAAGEKPGSHVPAGTYYLREAAAHDVDRIMGYGLVPVTTTTTFKDEKGSLQAFVPGSQPGVVVRSAGTSKDDIHRALAFDFATGNVDRHGGNWMVTGAGKLVLIDNGRAFTAEQGGFMRKAMVRGFPKYADMDGKIPAGISKEWADKRAAIETQLRKRGLSDAEAKAVGSRIARLGKAKTWRELYTG